MLIQRPEIFEWCVDIRMENLKRKEKENVF